MVAVEGRCDPQRVLAADRHERVEPLGREVREHRFDAALDLGRVRPRGAEDRPATRQEAGDVLALERREDPVDEPAPPFTHGDHLVAAVE